MVKMFHEFLEADRFYKVGQLVVSDLYCPSSPSCTGEMVRTTVSLSASKEPLKIDDWKGMNKINCLIAVFLHDLANCTNLRGIPLSTALVGFKNPSKFKKQIKYHKEAPSADVLLCFVYF